MPAPGHGQDVFSTVPPVEPVWPPHLVRAPGWFGGLEGYGGILTLGATDTREAYAFLGGQGRLRYDYYELGGYFETSDHPQKSDQYRAFGGFIGAWLPYRGWVDFEIAAAVGARNYESDDVRYGPGGYDDSSPTLGFRLGVSDRTSSYSALAGRVGGQLVFTYDLNPADEPWQEDLERDGMPVTQSGTTRVGGWTLAIALVLGFDYGKAIKLNPAVSESPK